MAYARIQISGAPTSLCNRPLLSRKMIAKGGNMVRYRNRKGKDYYLHVGKAGTGKPRYFFSTRKDEPLAPVVPQGYEIYEHPNAQVF